jgi:hypothetical protein
MKRSCFKVSSKSWRTSYDLRLSGSGLRGSRLDDRDLGLCVVELLMQPCRISRHHQSRVFRPERSGDTSTFNDFIDFVMLSRLAAAPAEHLNSNIWQT